MATRRARSTTAVSFKPDNLAVIRLPAEQQVCAAAFVWRVPGGLAWLGPGYSDPYPNTQPQFHVRPGALLEDGPRSRLVDAAGETVAVIAPMGDQEFDDSKGSCTAVLLDYADSLVIADTTIAAERARVSKNLRKELKLGAVVP